MRLDLMVRMGLLVLLVVSVASGCRKKPASTTEAANQSQPAGTQVQTSPGPLPGRGGVVVRPGPGGGVMGVRKTAERPRASNELRQIAIFYAQYCDDTGRPPASMQDFLGYLQRDASQEAKCIEEGIYLVYWNANLNNLPAGRSATILAYTRDTPIEGGLAAMADGSVQRITPQQFAAAAKAGGN